MTTDTEPLTGELVPVNPPPAPPMTLFGTSDPRLALERMAEIATALVDVIDRKRLYVTISGRKHITVEGWTTLGGMTGVVPIVTGTRPNESGDGIVAHVEARRVADGMVVGAAEGECSRAESKWKNRDPFAIRSMAQTRAISRALRAPLGQIIVLAGYEATPAEEMLVDNAEPKPAPSAEGPIPDAVQPTADQKDEINTLLRTLSTLDPGTDWPARCIEILGVPGKLMTRTQAPSLIRKLQQHAEELIGG